MNIPMNIPKGYRRLEIGEALRMRDKLQWNTFPEKLNDIHPSHVGVIIGDAGWNNGDQKVWQVLRKIESPWIAMSERKPDKNDWYFVSDNRVRGGSAFWNGDRWSGVSGLKGSFEISQVSHYMEIPDIPGSPTIIIQEGRRAHELIFNKDGSVKAGCVTIDSSTMDKIVERRKEVME